MRLSSSSASTVAQAIHGDEGLSASAFESKWKVCIAASMNLGYPAHITLHFQAFFDNASLTAPEVRRGLNSVFANDLVPDVSILVSALKATRRVNDFATFVHAVIHLPVCAIMNHPFYTTGQCASLRE